MPINPKMVKWEESQTPKINPKLVKWQDDGSVVKDIIGGAAKGIGNIGATIAQPFQYVAGGALGSNAQMRKNMGVNLSSMGVDTESIPFKASEIGSEILATAPVGGVLSSGASRLGMPLLSKAIKSGGMSLGGTTGNALKDIALRGAGGALVGGASAGLVNPNEAANGAIFGSAIPLSVAAAGGIGNKMRNLTNSAATSLMQSALKPPKGSVLKGGADKAILSMLDNGINVSSGGLAKTQGLIDDLNSQISSKIKNSTATINKADIIPYMNDARINAGGTPYHASDLTKLDDLENGFLSMPTAPGNSMTAQQAQDFKQAMYQRLKGSYGQIGNAETEGAKGLARGAKDQIVKAVPEVADLNAKESGLLEAQKLLANRLAVSGNKDPMGLAALVVSDPAAAATFMMNRSEVLKSLLARGLYKPHPASAVPSKIQGLLGGNTSSMLPPAANYVPLMSILATQETQQ